MPHLLLNWHVHVRIILDYGNTKGIFRLTILSSLSSWKELGLWFIGKCMQYKRSAWNLVFYDQFESWSGGH
jgi:hypothetical protein